MLLMELLMKLNIKIILFNVKKGSGTLTIKDRFSVDTHEIKVIFTKTDNFKKLVEKLSQKEDKAYMDSFKFFSDNYVAFFHSYKQNEESSKKCNINNNNPRMDSSENKTNINQNSVLSDFARSNSDNSNSLVNFPNFPILKEMNPFSDLDEELADEKSLRFDEIGNNIDNENY